MKLLDYYDAKVCRVLRVDKSASPTYNVPQTCQIEVSPCNFQFEPPQLANLQTILVLVTWVTNNPNIFLLMQIFAIERTRIMVFPACMREVPSH